MLTLTLLNLNLALAFGLELAALAAFGLWGVQTGGSTFSRVLLGAGAPLLLALFWGLLLSPKAPVTLPAPLKLLLKLGVFALAAAAFYSTERPLTAAVFAGLVILNATALIFAQQPTQG